jgi:hypothetical protein
MVWEIPVGTLAKAGVTAYGQQKKIQEIASKVTYYLTRGTLRIVVFGPGGVGKSTLGDFLSLENPSSFQGSAYKPSFEIEKEPLKGGYVGGLVIAPGQEEVFPEEWQKLFDYLLDGRSRVVVNVVSYGYHSIAKFPYNQVTKFPATDIEVFRSGMTKEEFVHAYLAAARRLEQHTIERLEPYLLTAKLKIRMVTLITKQDLWWNEWTTVRDHYENGPYGAVIKRIEEARLRSGRGFTHDYVPVSLVEQNFADGQGELLVPVKEGFDQPTQRVYQQALMDTIHSFARRK